MNLAHTFPSSHTLTPSAATRGVAVSSAAAAAAAVATAAAAGLRAGTGTFPRPAPLTLLQVATSVGGSVPGVIDTWPVLVLQLADLHEGGEAVLSLITLCPQVRRGW